MLKSQNKALLQRARETYGNKNQILVSAEECCELAKELMKYPRYETHEEGIKRTREKVLEERADVEIILDHIDSIYGFTEEEILQAAEPKLNRLKKWLDTSSSMQYTTEYRETSEEPDASCWGCFYDDHWDDPNRAKACKNCKNKRQVQSK